MNMNTIEESIVGGQVSVKGAMSAGKKVNNHMEQVHALTQGQSLADAKATFQAAMAEKEKDNEQTK